jgi:hypothetical protein
MAAALGVGVRGGATARLAFVVARFLVGVVGPGALAYSGAFLLLPAFGETGCGAVLVAVGGGRVWLVRREDLLGADMARLAARTVR